MTNIKNYIRKMSGATPMQTYLCEVVNVDGLMCECKPVHGGANFLEVRLKSVLDNNNDGLIITPKKGSNVIIGIIENNEASAFVVAFSEIEKLHFKNVGGRTFDLNKDEILINGNSFNGLVKLNELKENLDALKKYVEAMNSALPIAFQAILPTAPAPFVATGAMGATTYQSSMASKKIIFKDMENKKVKHG